MRPARRAQRLFLFCNTHKTSSDATLINARTHHTQLVRKNMIYAGVGLSDHGVVCDIPVVCDIRVMCDLCVMCDIRVMCDICVLCDIRVMCDIRVLAPSCDV